MFGIPMSEEIFDVVNDRDEVIGQRARSEVHRLGLQHRAVHVLVFNAQGQLFLQKRARWKEDFPGTWDSSAAGHLGTGEDYDDCARRELEEELGLARAPALERVFKLAACPQTGQEHVWVYRCQCEGPFSLHPDEIEEGAWFTHEQISRWMEERPGDFAGGFQLLWSRFRSGR
jgi:isopentenyl-diphosphate delta-isomerase type 1